MSVIDEGRYIARAVDGSWALKETSKGTPYIEVTFAIIGGPFDGHTVRWDGFLSDRAVERTIESLRHAGWIGDDLSAISELPEAVELVIEHEEYNGKVFPRVQWVNQVGGKGIGRQLDRGTAKSVAARLRELARSIGPAGASKAPQGPVAGHAQDEDDDIPF